MKQYRKLNRAMGTETISKNGAILKNLMSKGKIVLFLFLFGTFICNAQTSAKYDKIFAYSEGIAIVKLGDKYGYIDESGKEIVSVKYDKVESLKQGIARVGLNGKVGFIDKTGKEIVPLKYDMIFTFSKGIARVTLNGKFGYIDRTGKEITPCKYDKADNFSDDTNIVFVKIGDKYGIVGKNGEVVVPKYDNITTISKGVVVVKQNDKYGVKSEDKYGFIDENGKEITASNEVWMKDIPIDKTNTGVKPYIFAQTENGISGGSKSLTLSVINTKGDKSGFNAIVGSLYDYSEEKTTKGWVSVFREYAPTEHYATQFDFLDLENGKILATVGVNPNSEVNRVTGYERYFINWVKSFLDSTINKSNILEKSPNLVTSSKYDNLTSNFWSEGFAYVHLDGKYGYIDKTGKEVIPLKYKYANHFENGLALVYLEGNNKWGWIDKTGKEVIPIKYENANDFKDGIARVCLNGKWGWIDKSEKEIIPLKYEKAGDFEKGLASVKLNGKWGCIDKTGTEIIPIKYENDIWLTFQEYIELADVKLNGKYGWIDRTGKEVIPIKYEDVRDFQGYTGLAPAKLNGKWGFIDKTGNVVIPFRYDEAQGFSGRSAKVKLGNEEFYIDKNGNKTDKRF